ncbi:MAG: hypothetical protein ACWA6R_10230 [Nitrosomonas sp.]
MLKKTKLEELIDRAEYLMERKRMMQCWSEHLEAIERGAEVIPLFGKFV